MDFREVFITTGKFEKIIFQRALLGIIIIEVINFFLLILHGFPWYIWILPPFFIAFSAVILVQFRDKKMPSNAIVLLAIGGVLLLVISYGLNGGIEGRSSTYTIFGGLYLLLLITNKKLRNILIASYIGIIILLIILEMVDLIQLYTLPKVGALKYSHFIFVSFFIGLLIHSIKSYFDLERKELIHINRDLKGKQFLINNQYEALEKQQKEMKEMSRNLDNRIELRSKALRDQTEAINDYLNLNIKELKGIVPGYHEILEKLEKSENGIDEEVLKKVKSSFQLYEQRLMEISK